MSLAARFRGMSVRGLLSDALDQNPGKDEPHPPAVPAPDLSELAGNWTAGDVAGFEENTQGFNTVDPGLWQ